MLSSRTVFKQPHISHRHYSSLKRLRTIKQQALGIQHQLVPTVAHHARNLPRRLQPPQLQKPFILSDGLTDQFSRFRFTLSSDDDGLLLLDGLVDEVGGFLGRLLGDLLRFDRFGERGREGDVR